MASISWLKAASAGLLVALLAACGGGSTAPGAAALPEVAWASPAVFVTPGAANKSFALTGCERRIYNIDEPYQVLYKASLLIASNGDVSILASTTETATATVIFSIAFADAKESSWSVGGNTQTPTYSLYVNQSGRDFDRYFSVYSRSDSQSLNAGEEGNSAGYDIRDCMLTDKLALQVNADQARAAKNLGTTAGVNTYDGDDADGRIEAGIAFWQNENTAAPGDKYNFMRFNLGTGELASSASTTGTYSPISFSLPSGTTTYGAYGESLSRFESEFDYKDAKSICVSSYTYDPQTEQESGFGVYATAYGNKFYPDGIRIRQMSENFENPKDFEGSCNGK